MVCKGLREIQFTYTAANWSNVSPEQWTMGAITKLLEATHGQWLYCCIHIHYRCKGTQATLWKEELQKKIEAQKEMGYHGLLDEDLYLAEVNLEDLESNSGEQQEYWLVMICTVWEAGLLSGAAQQHAGCITTEGDGRFIT
jgi:hypothetical protein